MRVLSRVAVATLAATVLLTQGVASAGDNNGSQSAPVVSDPIATGLAGPLQIAIGPQRSVYIAQSFAGMLSIVTEDGQTDIPAPGIDGLDVVGRRVMFTTRADGEPGDPGFFADLRRLNRDESSTQIADLWAYEQTQNPDQVNSYGFVEIPAECAAKWTVEEAGPPQYQGLPDSNPFGVLAKGGTTYIADAGANAILKVTRRGEVSTVAVLPPQPVVITEQIAGAQGLDPCTIGRTYNFEPVPTDVEVGPHGTLYVTTLPGGPEDPSLGARGAVYQIDTKTGSVKQIASGLLGATNLAVGPHRAIYVTELFAGRVSKIGDDGKPVPVVDLPTPSGLEYHRGKLYVSYNVLSQAEPAHVATISLR